MFVLKNIIMFGRFFFDVALGINRFFEAAAGNNRFNRAVPAA